MCLRLFLVLFFIHASSLVKGQDTYRISTLDTGIIMVQIENAKALAAKYPDSAIAKLHRQLRQSELVGYKPGMRKVILELVFLFMETGRYEIGFSYARQCLPLCDSSIHRAELATLYNTIGNGYRFRDQFHEAYKAYLKAEDFASGNPLIQAKVWTNIGNVFISLNQPGKALGYHRRSSDVAMEEQNGYLWTIALLNIQNAYWLLGDLDSASAFADSAIRVAKTFHEYSLLNAAINFKGADLLRRRQPEKTLELLNAYDTLSKHVVMTARDRSQRYKVIGTAYRLLEDYQKAEQYLLMAKREVSAFDLTLSIQITEVYEAMGDYERAYEVYRQYKEKEDSLKSDAVHLQINELETRYRTAEKDKLLAENKLVLDIRAHQVEQRNQWLGIVGGGALLLSGFFLVFYRNVRQKQRLQLTAQENIRLKSLIEGEEQERERISGELHDGIGGILSAAKMSFSGLKLSQDVNTQKYTHGIQLLDEAYKELRRTAHNLSPVLLKREGLIAAVSAFCDKATLAYKPEVCFQHFGDFSGISEALVLTTYRVIQELVHNALKHAKADRILVQVSHEGNDLNITVEDDGMGMPDYIPSGGIGMENMYARVRALNGTIDIDSRKGEGTTVYVHFGW